MSKTNTAKATSFQTYKSFKKSRPLSRAAQARVDAAVRKDLLEISLSEVRAMAEMTQTDVATTLETTQTQISRLEGREDHLVSTLRKYIEALGGRLDVVAHFGDKSVRLRGV